MGVLVRNASMAEDLSTLRIPTRPDGSFYRYEMIADGGWSRYYDDDITNLVGFLIPTYTDLPEEDRLAVRIRHAVNLQVRLQARLNMFFALSPRTSDEQELLSGPRHEQPMIEEWDCVVPLILIDSFYAPYTDVPRPASSIADVAMPPNIWWFRPAESETEYLCSLHEASLIDLHITKDEVA